MSDRDRFADLSYRLLQNEDLVRQDQQFWIDYLLKFLRGKDVINTYSLPDVLEWKFTGDNIIFSQTALTVENTFLTVNYSFEDLITVGSITTGPGGNKQITCCAVDGTYLYVGGDFATINGITANCVAKMDLTTGQWFALGDGIGDAFGGAVAMDIDSNGNLYVGGNFGVTYGYLAVWNGSAWADLNVDNDISDLKIRSDVLYICGSFDNVGGNAADGAAKYDIGTTTWTALNTGANAAISAIDADSSGNVYIGGSFTSPGTRVAQWTGAAWSDMGSGFDAAVFSIYVDGNNTVYAGGSRFNTYNIQRWDGYSWVPMTGINGASAGSIFGVDGYGGIVYAGGAFTTPTLDIAKWLNDEWLALTDVLTNAGSSASSFLDMDVDSNGNLYLVGFTRNAANTALYYVKKYNAPKSTTLLGYSSEDQEFKSTDDRMTADSDVLYPSQSAVRDYSPMKKITTDAPTVNEDVSAGYRVGDMWVDTDG